MHSYLKNAFCHVSTLVISISLLLWLLNLDHKLISAIPLTCFFIIFKKFWVNLISESWNCEFSWFMYHEVICLLLLFWLFINKIWFIFLCYNSFDEFWRFQRNLIKVNFIWNGLIRQVMTQKRRLFWKPHAKRNITFLALFLSLILVSN